MRLGPARLFHALTFAVAVFALVLQLVLVWQGSAILDQTDPPGRVTRLVRFASYLTIWSNALVAWSALTLALGRNRDTPWARALRLDAVLVCLGGGIVHFFFLRPILDLHGASAFADHLLHQVVPLLALVGWSVFGPRGRAAWSDLGRFLVVPLAWFGYTLLRGAFVDWYPYPFVNVTTRGYGTVLLNGLGVGTVMLLMFLLALGYERRRAGSR